ncbi:GAF domain-containing sensor histidine kinase [Romeria aff. gracilis LEGE 07310]|uniref:histidine kinase n=1 Tax=Vasconcelosia minhoensis LEGE 07310 TaxID=915328 RepID=A0A8J7A5Q2_9CYAN|nr:ATP-binding protein [Romeria gracilis]MBE9076952.1 GAF domain-containing sensor histidine kinase [Romeria aff. gracilis LEGE 07310]
MVQAASFPLPDSYPTPPSASAELQRQRLITQTVDKIRRSLDIPTIFETTTQEVRQLIGAERVVIYRFNNDWSGEFVFEAVADGWNSLMYEQTQQPELNANISECSLKSLATMPDTDTYLQETQGGRFSRGELFRVCDDIYAAGFSDCYIKSLESYRAQAYAIFAIYCNQKLWGLLAAFQNSGPRQWQAEEIDLLTQVGTQLGIALQQAELLQQTQTQAAKLQTALNDLRKTQSQLIHGEKMAGLGQLVAGIAHEINNPVSFIRGNVPHAHAQMQDLIGLIRLYQQKLPQADAELQQYIADIELDYLVDDLPRLMASMESGAERIQAIVESLRNFSRLDEVGVKTVDLHEGIDSTLMILTHRLNRQPHRSEIKVVKQYGKLPAVGCYVGELNQVFMNLLTNAIDAIDQRAEPDRAPQIQVQTEQLANGDIRIAIADSGPGIPVEIQPRIFDPFFTSKPVGQGTGLGLSISYQIITERHGGSLTCQSTPGQGTEFVIQIPPRQAFGSPEG